MSGRVDTSMADLFGPALAEVMKPMGIKFAFAFGSRVRDEARGDSDLDVAVMPEGDLALLERSRLAGLIAEVTGIQEVDIVVLPEASLELRAKVLREGELVFSSDEPARVAFQVDTFSRFIDFEPTLRRHQDRRLRQFAEHGLGEA